MVSPFKNEPFTDFKDEANRAAFVEALDQRASRPSGRRTPPSSTASACAPPRRYTTEDPERPVAEDRHVPALRRGRRRPRGLAAAHAAFPAWADTPWAERAHLLFEAADAAAPRQAHLLGVDGVRGRQDLGRGRRRHRRGDRLLRVLRARDAALRAAACRVVQTGERERVLLRAARRRRRDPAVELPARDPRRHDHRGARHRQHRRA